MKFLNELQQIEFVAFDFDGVFTDNRVWISEDGKESVACYRSDGYGVMMLRDCGVQMVIISSESNPVVEQRAKKHRLPVYRGCEDKLSKLRELLEEANIRLEQTAFVGNDINDIACLKEVGVSVCVQDAYPEVKEVSDIVLEKKGGYGAVREFCEMVRNAKKAEIVS